MQCHILLRQYADPRFDGLSDRGSWWFTRTNPPYTTKAQMNIFVLDRDPRVAASYHCDKHVIKMILETAQMLSTAHHMLDPRGPVAPHVYRATHHNHPCNIWVRKNSANYMWAERLFRALLDEYTLRYGKHHLSGRMALDLTWPPTNIQASQDKSDFPQCVPDDCKHKDVVQAYRQYYMKHKSRFAKWAHSPQPEWYHA